LSTPKALPTRRERGERMIERFAVGLILSLGIAGGAHALRLLTRDGVVAATAVGTLVFGGGGWSPAALLVLFFLTSSVLTRWQAQRKPQPEHGAGLSGPRGRSGIQVLANGTVAAALALWYGFAPSADVLTAFAGAVAASAADTWATEIGLLSSTPPRLITTGSVVTPGRSGGITWIGTLGGAAGAGVLAGAAWALVNAPFAAVAAAGIIAMVVDSLLGATTEGRVRWVGNDGVNLIATATGAVLASILA
jgi:uncharacterized protein (TIGR00297 family)